MRTLQQTGRAISLLGFSLLLVGCTRVDNFSDLQLFIDGVNNQPGSQVEPVPEFPPYEGFIYSAAAFRSPFSVPLAIDLESTTVLAQDVEPDLNRIRGELEVQALSEFSMVGMLTRNGIYEALLEDGFGEVHRVGIGGYIGRNHGRINNITESQLSLIEIVPNGSGGWVERPQTLTMQ